MVTFHQNVGTDASIFTTPSYTQSPDIFNTTEQTTGDLDITSPDQVLSTSIVGRLRLKLNTFKIDVQAIMQIYHG